MVAVEVAPLLASQLQDERNRCRLKQKLPNSCANCSLIRCACVWFLMCRWVCCFPAVLILRAVAALAVRASSEPVKTFSISFAEASFDESAYARGVAKFLGTDHHEERLSANLAANLVSEIGAWMDEPFSDPSLVPTYLLSRFTRKHVTVALGGDGGDELFAGYPMYRGSSLGRVLQACAGARCEPGLLSRSFGCLPVKTKNLSFDYKALRFVTGAKYDAVARHHVWFGSFTPEEQEQLLTREALASHRWRHLSRMRGRCAQSATPKIWSNACRASTRVFISPKTF